MNSAYGMQFLDILLGNWEAIAGILSFVGFATVLWLSTKFPRRKEFEAKTERLHTRLDALEQRLDNHDLLMQKVAGQLDGIDERLKSLDEKMQWRLLPLEKQVEILLRGHLEFE